MLAFPPRLKKASAEMAPIDPLPFPAPLPGEILELAHQILAHRFPLLGTVIETGPDIEWRRDYIRGLVTGTSYFRTIPYLDVSLAGDHKIIWELNRHQHLVVLAQAYQLKGDRRYLVEIAVELRSWWEQNPFLRGINWASALEIAFRALSWIAVVQLVGDTLEPALLAQLQRSLYQHGMYLEHNLSTYFSPNTHLLGEGVALHAIAIACPHFDRAARWRKLGNDIVVAQLENQVHADGSHFEQSSYYHVYARDFFRLHDALSDQPALYREKLQRMEHYLGAITGASGLLPALGDDDGGRLFHPYGDRLKFGGSPATTSHSELFPDVGIAVIQSGDIQIVIDAGPFGFGGAGHSHSDTLSFVARFGGTEIFIDPGTYTYTAEPEWRDRFRGSAAHNTIRVDARDQADPVHPFRWLNKPAVRVREWTGTMLDAECTYRNITHRRRFSLDGNMLHIDDEVTGIDAAEHFVEQFWHPAHKPQMLDRGNYRVGPATLSLPVNAGIELSAGGEFGWRSTVLGEKFPSPLLRVFKTTKLPYRMTASIAFGER